LSDFLQDFMDPESSLKHHHDGPKLLKAKLGQPA